MRGPPTKAAFGTDGSPTKALEGFCKKNGVSPADVTRQTDAKGVEYVYAQIKEVGRPAAEVRACCLRMGGVLSSIHALARVQEKFAEAKEVGRPAAEVHNLWVPGAQDGCVCVWLQM